MSFTPGRRAYGVIEGFFAGAINEMGMIIEPLTARVNYGKNIFLHRAERHVCRTRWNRLISGISELPGIDCGTPPDSPAPLTTQPAPLEIHPPIHTAPPATTHPAPLAITHIPLALLPTPMPEVYVSNWAAHYVMGSSNPSPVRTLLVADTHSVRSTPPGTPPLPPTEVAVFIVRMENEPGETPSSSS